MLEISLCINIRITIIIISLSRPKTHKRNLFGKNWKELKGVREKFLALAIFGSMIIDARAWLHEREEELMLIHADEFIICGWMGFFVGKAHIKGGIEALKLWIFED